MKLPMLLAMGNGELAARAHTGFGLIGSFRGWLQGFPLWVLLPVGLVSGLISVVMSLLVLFKPGGKRNWSLVLGAVMFGGVAAVLPLPAPF
ncbi:hypothetical protein AB0L00_19775 [Actinoallomurus sp. NPDC052308]|uniref:hypothetical protein n=1 Tax=Actinoallomurus sp. NPDC052308 TaxID=3155530 RepID=UPI003438476E